MSIFDSTFKNPSSPQAVTIGTSGGVLTLSKPGYYVVTSFTGTSDSLTQVAGLPVGSKVTLSPASGHTITVTDGTYLFLASDLNFTMGNVYDNITLMVTAAGYCREEGRVSNG
jgi:hypothetical protein